MEIENSTTTQLEQRLLKRQDELDKIQKKFSV
jgi:hypothetical protein